MSAREKRMLNALRFIKACPDVYYGRPPQDVIDHMGMTAKMALEYPKRRKKAA